MEINNGKERCEIAQTAINLPLKLFHSGVANAETYSLKKYEDKVAGQTQGFVS